MSTPSAVEPFARVRARSIVTLVLDAGVGLAAECSITGLTGMTRRNPRGPSEGLVSQRLRGWSSWGNDSNGNSGRSIPNA